MKRRKTIEDLYREVKDFDLVLTHDAALADALNRRLNSPRIGPFAETVKNYVLKKTRYTYKDDILDEQKIVSSLAGQTGSYQKARYFLSLLEDCWNKMEGIDPSYFPVPEFMQIPENVFRFFKTRRTYWLEAGRIVFSQKARIAVIEKELLSPFEGSVLPSFAENISLFSEEKADFPGFCVFDTNHDLIQAVARSIHVENQQNFGIVVDEGSLYSSTIKGALLAKGVNIIGQKDVMDDIPFRQTLSVLRMSLDAEALLIRDVAGFLGLMGARMLTENYSYFLKDYPENEPGFEKVTKLYQDIRQIKDMTFQEFIRTYPLYAGNYLESIVRNYSFENKMIGQSLPELEYLLFLFGHELGKNVKGVVLADARSSLIIDRPVVFFVMPDNTWISERFSRLWIDRKNVENMEQGERELIRKKMRTLRKEIHKKELLRFLSLIQSGNRRYFMAADAGDAPPCYYFRESDSGFSLRFTEGRVPHKKYAARYEPAPVKKETKKGAKAYSPLTSLSASSLNLYSLCPKKYAFSRLVSDIKQEPALKGSLIHQFAEFYFYFPQLVKKHGLPFFADIVMKEISPLTEDAAAKINETWILSAMKSVTEFIDSLDIVTPSGIGEKGEQREKNIFAERLSKETHKQRKRQGCAEWAFQSSVSRVKGRFDLFVSESVVVDYKTSSQVPSVKNIIERADMSLSRDDIDFQGVLYLYAMREYCEKKPLEVRFFYPVADLGFPLAGNKMKRPEKQVVLKYFPQMFSDFVSSRECFEELSLSSKQRNAFLQKTGFENYRMVKDFDIPFESGEKEKALSSPGGKRFIEFCLDIAGKRTKTNRNTAESIIRKICDRRRMAYYKEDLDLFGRFLEEKADEIGCSYVEGFDRDPITLTLCRKCFFHDICEMDFPS